MKYRKEMGSLKGLIEKANLDSDEVSFFVNGEDWENCDGVVIVVKGRQAGYRADALFRMAGMITPGKAVVDSSARPMPPISEFPQKEDLPVVCCWAFAVVMDRIGIEGGIKTMKSKSILGYEFAECEETALGQFVRECQEKAPGFMMGKVQSVQIGIDLSES